MAGAAGSGTPDLLEVGRIERAHGLRGELLIKLTTNVTERLAAGSVLYAGRERRPLTVAAARPHQHRWIASFEGVADRTAAEALHGLALFAPPLVGVDDEDDGTLWVHELIGCHVVDQHDVDRGVVEAVQDNPASDLLVLEDGHLVPLTFVVAVDGDVIRVEVPAGLFDDEDPVVDDDVAGEG